MSVVAINNLLFDNGLHCIKIWFLDNSLYLHTPSPPTNHKINVAHFQFCIFFRSNSSINRRENSPRSLTLHCHENNSILNCQYFIGLLGMYVLYLPPCVLYFILILSIDNQHPSMWHLRTFFFSVLKEFFKWLFFLKRPKSFLFRLL